MKPQGNKRSISITHPSGDCVAGLEGCTFGVLSGKPFDTFNLAMSSADKIQWALANASLNERIAKDLRRYAEALAAQRP